jgi:dihydrofolate synthase/folylpolyglutamate synthase
MDDNLLEMRKLAASFDNPQSNLKIIHVAGTNGKGSVSLKVASCLQEMGYKTGLFTSPHINSFRERI